MRAYGSTIFAGSTTNFLLELDLLGSGHKELLKCGGLRVVPPGMKSEQKPPYAEQRE
jgi:hypothetical protein